MGSILETFLILFESNADDVEKGAKKADKAAKDLDKSLSSVDTASAKLGQSFLTMATRAATALGAIVGISAVFASAVAAARYANALGDVSQALGVNVEELSLWSDAVAKSGGSAEGFQSTLGGMVRDLQSLATTGNSKLLPFFQQLGVSMLDANGKARNVMEILPDLADAFAGISKQEALGIGSRIGLDTGTILLLQQGRREVESIISRQKELGSITEEQVKISKAYNDQLQDTAHAYRSLSLNIATGILPVITKMLSYVEKFVTFLAENKNFTVGFFLALAGVVAGMVAPAFWTAATAVWAFMAPLLPIIAIITAVTIGFGLLFDDIMAFVSGGDSLIGRVWEWLKGLTAFKVTVEALSTALRALGKVWDSVKDGWDYINGGDSRNITPTGRLVGAAQQNMSSAAGIPLSSLSSTSITGGATNSRTTNVKVDNVIVQTQATDAEGIAAAASTGLMTQMRQAVNNYDDGIRA